jgi:hypothetical protein
MALPLRAHTAITEKSQLFELVGQTVSLPFKFLWPEASEMKPMPG